MEDGGAGPQLGEAAEAAEARARPGVTLRPFAQFSGAAEADEGGGDWSFIDCEMEEVDLQDLPSATIACHLDPRVFVDGLCRVRAGPRAVGRRADTCCRRRRSGSQRRGPGRRRAWRAPRGCGDTPGRPAAAPSGPAWWGGVAFPEGPGAPGTCWTAAQPASAGTWPGHRLPAAPLPRASTQAGTGRE